MSQNMLIIKQINFPKKKCVILFFIYQIDPLGMK